MKLNFTLLLLFTFLFANAKEKSATIKYTNGQVEEGAIHSFLEDRFFDFNFFGTFEQGLIYNDKVIQFRLTDEKDSKRVSIDDIDQITLHYEGFDKIYKALFIRNIDRKGFTEKSKVRIFLPLLRSGKINVYGFYNTEVSSNSASGSFPTSSTVTVTEMFYYQNANEDYAIDYYNIEIQDMLNIRDRFANPLKELFKDCPELVTKVHNSFYDKNLSKEEKKKLKEQSKNTFKFLQKEYKKIPADQRRGDLLLFHQYNLKGFDDMLMEYEKCN